MNGELKSRWLPKARGDDNQILSRLRGGGTFGDVRLDKAFSIGRGMTLALAEQLCV
jgi:hypothetical protein